MSSYLLQPAWISYCQGAWDDNLQSYRTNDNMDIVQCCLDDCEPRIKLCFADCKKTFGPNGTNPDYSKYQKCFNKCNELTVACENICADFPSQAIEMIGDCAYDLDCGSSPLFDIDCFRNKKEEIINCCKKACPVETCDRECEYFYDYLAKGSRSELSDIANNYRLESDEFNGHDSNKNRIKLVIGIAIIILIIIGVVLLIRFKK